MPHFYAITNSQSFKARAEISFRLTQKASSRGWGKESSVGHRLATATAVVGPNGAGETSLIKPLAFLNASEAKKVRQNASLISTAAQYGVELTQHLAVASVSSNVMHVGRLYTDAAFGSATRFFHGDEVLREKMVALLRAWDLGLSGVAIRKVDFPLNADMTHADSVIPFSQYIPFGVHTLKDGSTIELPLLEESSGTKTVFVTLWYLLSVLSTGGVAVIDELESDMHPHMIEPLLELFASRATNPHQAQIIFTSHSVEVMNLLGKSQVILVEKTHCESEAWRLDSMEGVRSQDNLYAKYMSGAYGAVPQL